MKFSFFSTLTGLVLVLSTQSTFAACTTPAGKTFAGHFNDELYYTSADGNTNLLVWGRKYAARWVFSAANSTPANQTIKMTGYAINANEGGYAVLVDATTVSVPKATYTFSTTTCSGVVTITPKTVIANSTYTVFFQVAGSGTIIHTVNQNTPTASFVQPLSGKTTLVGGGTLNLE